MLLYPLFSKLHARHQGIWFCDSSGWQSLWDCFTFDILKMNGMFEFIGIKRILSSNIRSWAWRRGKAWKRSKGRGKYEIFGNSGRGIVCINCANRSRSIIRFLGENCFQGRCRDRLRMRGIKRSLDLRV